MIIICNMTTPPTLSSTFLAHYQQCVQPWKQQWLSWQLPAALPAALRNELVSQFHLEAQSERGNQQSPSNRNCHPTTSAKRKRKKRPLVSREESCWWKKFLTNEKHILQLDMNTWEARLFHKKFRLPFDIFLKLYDMTISNGWYDPHRKDCTNLLCKDLELLLLGVLYTLSTGASHLYMYIQTDISKEVHRKFFIHWTSKFAEKKDEYVYILREEEEDDDQLQQILNDYSSIGLPGCIGSVDCVHIGWNRCPAYQKNIFKGSKGYPSVVFEVVSDHRRKILSISYLHPGTRNDKHIVKFDAAVSNLHDRNLFLGRQEWNVLTVESSITCKGYYFICDGGYLRWPVLICPIKYGNEHGKERAWGMMVESVRKDIECTFGILKSRWLFLKNWNNLS